jgi:phage-related baseplate assembly protein
MTDRFVSTSLDLSRLPPPDVIDVDYEGILSARLARLQELWPALDTTGLETEPGVVLEQTDAYREALTLAAINDAAKAVLLAFARGGFLDNLAAFFGVARLVIVPATDTAPAVMELDDDLRERILLAPEALPYAGLTGGGYVSLARKTAPSLKDAKPIKRGGGRVDLVLLARDGDGAVPADVVSSVYAAFQDDAATQLTDVVTVRGANIVHYAPTITLYTTAGPNPDSIKAAADTAVRTYATLRNKVGLVVYAQMLAAVASAGVADRADIDIGDVDPGEAGAAFLTGLTINVQVVA